MASFDFDQPVPRDGTASVKHDGRAAMFGTAHVTPLWVADMDFAAPPPVVAALTERARHPVYGYTLCPESAFEALQRWLAARHGWNAPREHIQMCPGVVPTLYAAVQAFTRPGEHVIVQPPVYPPFFSAIRDSGRRVVENPLIERDGRWTMDFDQLESCAAQGGSRLLFLCSPHNPVGRVWSHEDLDTVLAIARRHGLIVLSDEIHADLTYPGVRHIPLATLARPGDRVLTTVAPSKTFNVPGLGLSALIADDTERRAMERAFGMLHVGASNPFSVVAFEAAYRDGGPWLDALMSYLESTRDELIDFVTHRLPGIHPVAPEGTYLIWLDCRGLGLDDDALRDFFIAAGLGLNPGASFGTGGSGHMRLNLASPRAVIRDALTRLEAALPRR